MSTILFEGLEAHSLAEQVANAWVTWDAGRQKWKARYSEVLQYIYATSTADTSNAANGWSHTTHIPKLTQIHDNLGANYAHALFTGDWFAFDPATEEELDASKRRKIEGYIRTKHDQSGFVLEIKKCLQDWVQAGNCFGRLDYVREVVSDVDGESPAETFSGPRLSRISPLDIVFDYTAQSFDRSPKILRDVFSIGDILTKFEDSNQSLRWDYTVIDQLTEMRRRVCVARPEDTYKTLQRQYDGFGTAEAYFKSGTVELLTFYGDIYDNATGELHRGRQITVVDRRWILSNVEIATLNRKPMIFQCGWRKRPDNLWAQGPLDNLVGMQYLIDHLENARADAFDKILTPDRVIIGNVEVEEEGSVTTYYIDDGQGSVHNLGPDTNVLNADNQIALKEAQMEAYVGAPREAMGLRSPGEKTKFEVQQLGNAASRMFQNKIEDFEKEFVEPLLQGELEISYRFLSLVDVARTFNEDLAIDEFLSVTKDDLRASGKLKARGASHYAQKAVLVQELQQFQQILAGDQEMRLHFPAKRRAQVFEQALGFDRYKLFEEFGAVAESVELQQAQGAAQSVLADNQAAAEAVQQP